MRERKRYSQQAQTRFFEEGEVWSLLVQIFDGITAAKQYGILLDDVQPVNILMDDKAGPNSLKIKLFNPRYYMMEKYTSE